MVAGVERRLQRVDVARARRRARVTRSPTMRRWYDRVREGGDGTRDGSARRTSSSLTARHESDEAGPGPIWRALRRPPRSPRTHSTGARRAAPRHQPDRPTRRSHRGEEAREGAQPDEDRPPTLLGEAFRFERQRPCAPSGPDHRGSTSTRLADERHARASGLAGRARERRTGEPHGPAVVLPRPSPARASGGRGMRSRDPRSGQDLQAPSGLGERRRGALLPGEPGPRRRDLSQRPRTVTQSPGPEKHGAQEPCSSSGSGEGATRW